MSFTHYLVIGHFRHRDGAVTSLHFPSCRTRSINVERARQMIEPLDNEIRTAFTIEDGYVVCVWQCRDDIWKFAKKLAEAEQCLVIHANNGLVFHPPEAIHEPSVALWIPKELRD